MHDTLFDLFNFYLCADSRTEPAILITCYANFACADVVYVFSSDLITIISNLGNDFRYCN
jgi:hypothetical protein